MWWDWDGVDWVNKVPKTFSAWLTKQTSHFAGTNKQLHRMIGCDKRGDSVKHITRCQDEGRLAMLRASMKDLVEWLYEKDTDDDLVRMVEEYLLAQGEIMA